MTPDQRAIHDAILSHAIRSPGRELTYQSEWTGYLPFGAAHYLQYDGVTISDDFPLDWTEADLAALVEDGFLRVTAAWTNPEDEFEVRVTYTLCTVPGTTT